MVLDSKTIKKIEDFVHSGPRTVQEIAHLLQKNWRTADSYIAKIASENATIGIRTFREGTRGALKIVFWNNLERINSSQFQEALYNSILRGKSKFDFSAFDIYQFADEKNREAFAVVTDNELHANQDLAKLLRGAKSSVLLFSGNLSWLNSDDGNGQNMLEIIEELAMRGVKFKALTRIDVASIRNLNKATAINKKLGKDVIEIKHCEQPLRAFIIDDALVRLKEIKIPETYKKGELDKKTIIYYDISDKIWVSWLSKVFSNLYSTSVSLKKRAYDLQSIKNLKII